MAANRRDKHVFLTGGTGFLGTLMAEGLVRDPDLTLYVLVRAGDRKEAGHRLLQAWQTRKALTDALSARVVPIPGDFTRKGLGLSKEDRRVLTDKVSLVIHAGAEIGFKKSRRDHLLTNYQGTRNVLSLARRMEGLRRLVHISTAYVAGTRQGQILETDPPGETFSTHYERSKALAEGLVRESGLPYTICRPGMIVGETGTGWIRSFNTVYYVLKLLLQGRLPLLPIRRETPLNIVPGDYAAGAVLKAAFSEAAAGETLHLTCPSFLAPAAGDLYDYVRDWAERNLSLRLSPSVFLPLPALKGAGLAYNRGRKERKKSYAGNLMTLLPYFYAGQEFDRTCADKVLGPYDLDWRTYIDALLTFACRKNFMRQTGQTVFEQALVRRSLDRFPITYHDIEKDKVTAVTGPEVNARILRVRDVLYARGIRKGDRVALTGINSAAYLVLEHALGLLGAVSVPIYYTAPAAEVSLLLKKSGAGWFFIGDKRMLDKVRDMETEARMVAFPESMETTSPSVMSWKTFLDLEAGPALPQYPEPGDLATIRYTSGTTGEPKGVMFSFSQLAWMGQVMAELVSWEDRQRPMRYLSFLPLSHVVEGILASCAPYYLLSRVDYYFLNDFSSLTDALPGVRPTVFFSVPRFYEKVWDQAASNPLGKAWLDAPEGAWKRALGAVLKRAVMKKAGIDACSQLIVGSAPVSEKLLLQFRALGIEIHNAYGQTEAPLITINRTGDNVIPTIGTPLPETRVWAEADNELIVEGPQVALGYYGLETDTIRDGVLRTGDLGKILEDGHILLEGRKKDFLITAYGKNISIPKLETRLKDIPGVSEAVLVGEGRPYCTALLWLESPAGDLGRAIETMNENLSHPEQIRRYKIVERPLSIEAGELTPNLKVRRGPVLDHLAKEIEELYS